MKTAKRKHNATLVNATPVPATGPKSFIFQCREAAARCYDGQVAAAMRSAADDLDQAVRDFTVAVTPVAMTHLNCMWARAVLAYTKCQHVPPTPPNSSVVDSSVDKLAEAA